MKVTDVRICLFNLKKVEGGLSALSIKKMDLELKKKLHDAVLEISEVSNDLKERLKQLENSNE